MLTITLKGKELTLAANLRVAYELQSFHNHKSYMDIFSEMDSMKLEEQVDIVFLAAKNGKNDEFPYDKKSFLDAYLDENNASGLMNTIEKIMYGILGKTPEELKAMQESMEASEENKGIEGN